MAKKNGDTRNSAAPPVTTEVTLAIQVDAPPDDLLGGAQIDSRRLTMKALKGKR